MTNLLEQIVGEALDNITGKDVTKGVDIIVSSNTSTAEIINKELEKYYQWADTLILSNINPDRFNFEWNIDDKLEDFIYTIKYNYK